MPGLCLRGRGGESDVEFFELVGTLLLVLFLLPNTNESHITCFSAINKTNL